MNIGNYITIYSPCVCHITGLCCFYRAAITAEVVTIYVVVIVLTTWCDAKSTIIFFNDLQQIAIFFLVVYCRINYFYTKKINSNPKIRQELFNEPTKPLWTITAGACKPNRVNCLILVFPTIGHSVCGMRKTGSKSI